MVLLHKTKAQQTFDLKSIENKRRRFYFVSPCLRSLAAQAKPWFYVIKLRISNVQPTLLKLKILKAYCSSSLILLNFKKLTLFKIQILLRKKSTKKSQVC